MSLQAKLFRALGPAKRVQGSCLFSIRNPNPTKHYRGLVEV